MQTGDATKLPPELQPAALIFSCFTMQQLPDPDKVLAAWLGALAPGGILAGEACLPLMQLSDEPCRKQWAACSVLLAKGSARAGLHHTLRPICPAKQAHHRELVGVAAGGRGKHHAVDAAASAQEQTECEPRHLQAQSAGARVLIDEQPAHSMSFDSAAHFFNVMMSAGPAQARLTAGGPEAIADTRQRFLAATQDRSPFVIAPSARMMVLQAPDAAL